MINIPRRIDGKANPEYDRRYYLENKEKIMERKKKHRQEKKEYDRQYYRENREKILERTKIHQKTRPEINRRAVKKYKEKYPEKMRAGEQARHHVPLDLYCERCESIENLERHHPDYSKPLEVMTVCRRCHTEIHRGGNE